MWKWLWDWIMSRGWECFEPFNLIGQLGTTPAKSILGGLDITMYHCAHQHGLVDAEGGHFITSPLMTPLCVWFWAVVIQGHGVSLHDLQTSFQFPLSFDLYVPLQHSCLLHPSVNIFQTLSVPLQPFRVITSSLAHLLPVGGSWGA